MSEKQKPIYINLVFGEEQKDLSTKKVEQRKYEAEKKAVRVFDKKNELRPEKKLKSNKSFKKNLNSKVDFKD